MNIRNLSISAVCSVLLGGTVNLYADSPMVSDEGKIDGGARILRIDCPSGSRTTVRVYIEDYDIYKPGMTCIYKADGHDLCKQDWNHDEAAVEACNQ